MKIKLSVVLITSLVLVILMSSLASLTACTSKTTPTTTTAPSPTTPLPTFELKFLDQYTPQQAAAQQSELLGKLIEEATGGRVKFTYYHAESLGKAAEFVNLLNGGVTDVVNITPGNFPTQFEVESYVNIPGVGINSRASGVEVLWALYDKGYLTGLKNYKVLAFNPTPTMNIWLKKKVTTVDGLKGLKIRGGDAQARKMLDLVGAVGTSMPSSEVYMGLDRGTLDGTMTADEQVVGNKFYEVVKYGIYEPKTLIGCVFIIMTQATWNKLPKDVQDMVDKGIVKNKTAFVDSVKDPDAQYQVTLKQNGMDLYSFSAEETAKLFAAAVPLKKDWITAQTAKGVKAQEIADLVASIVAKYK